MVALTVRRHMMPGVTMIAFVTAALPAGAPGLRQLALGIPLLALYWLVEWLGIEGSYEGRLPRRRSTMLLRSAWLAGLVLCVLDALWLHWTPWQGAAVRAVGAFVFLSGIALRLWSMRTLSRAFSYDIKVVEGHELVRGGPYRVLRHPAYTGLVLWSAGFALWNPSLPGLVLLVALTVQEVAFRIREEERLLAEHFGAAWRDHARATWAVVPLVW